MYGGGERRWNEVEILAGLEPQQNDVDGGRRFSWKNCPCGETKATPAAARLRLCKMMIIRLGDV